MDRVVVNPAFIYAIMFVLLLYTVPGFSTHWGSAVLIGLILLEFFAEFGQMFNKLNCPRIACILLQIATVLRQPWLLIPGKYPLRVYISSTNQLSMVLCDLQKYSEVLKVNARNIELLKKRMPVSTDLAGETVNQSYIYSQMGEAQRAELVAEEALGILQSCGTEIDTSTVLNNLGVIYLDMKLVDKAMDAFDKSLKIRQRNKASKSQLGFANGNIGYALVVAEKYSQAEPYLRKAIELSESGPAAFKATARNNLGECLRGQDKLVEAEVMLKDSLRIRTKSLTKNHAHLGYSYHNLAKLYRDKGELEEAEVYFDKAIEVRSKHPGAKFKDFNETGLEYCKLLIQLDRADEAKAFSSVHQLEKVD